MTRLPLVAILLYASILSTSGLAQEKSGKVPSVSQLIKQLASESYATRSRARDRLRRLGLEAFDELEVASKSEDIEIAASARYLISSLLVSWSKESDPAEVRDALNEYGAQDASERASRIQLLAELSDRKGLAALVRLARFETLPGLRRKAALLLMQQTMSESKEVRQRHAQTILDQMSDSERQASQWLKAYADDLLSGDYSAERWDELVTAQRRQIDAVTDQTATRESVLELVRVCAQRAAQHGHRDEALRLATENLDLIPPTTRDLVNGSSWAIDNRLHEFVLTLREKHRRMFDQHAMLLYTSAEARKMTGDVDGAEELAAQAIRIRPFPETEEEKEKLSTIALEEIAQAHRGVGLDLQAKGLFQWAEREYRLIIEELEITQTASTSARSHLADMLAELERHEEVIEVLEPLIERAENDNAFNNRMKFNLYSIEFFRSQVEHHRGLMLLEKGKADEAKQYLLKAFRMNPDNIDILIRMYRTDGDLEWKNTVRQLLSVATRDAESGIRSAETGFQQQIRGLNNDRVLAKRLNQYAWLISNTEGDYRRALRESLRSLKLQPNNAAQLDTCARCYMALGRFDDAARMQRQALRLEPYSPPMVRQMAEIEKELAKSKPR